MRSRTMIAAAALVLAGCAGRGGGGEVRVQVTDAGFVPASVTFAKGRPGVLVITRKVEATCATEAVFAETGMKYDLPLGQDVRIAIPTDSARTLHYACGMDMYKGQVEVK